MSSRHRVFSILAIVSVALILASFANNTDRLEKIKAKGELIVLTRNAATAYYESREGDAGIEFDMASSFAEHLGVEAKFIVKDDVSDLFSSLLAGDADIAAAGLTQTQDRSEHFLFGPTYQEVSQQVVCRRGGKRPKKAEDLVGLTIQVPVGSSYANQLQKLQAENENIQWQEVDNTDTETLLENVWLKKTDCTIADDNIVAINRRYFPELSVRFNLTEPEPLAWVMPYNADGLQSELEDWFENYSSSGELENVIHRYYGFIERFDYVDARAFQRKIKSHLPKYKETFKKAAKHYNVNWILLAAQAYQESHWRARAKSPTGVRGIMMLTRSTAKQIGITNRLDPAASIMGGAYYFNHLRKRLPESVTEPDRSWVALAAYNVGMGHIWDARKLAKSLNKNPDSWKEFSTVLPLLSQKKYYKKLKHGYARGHEPVSYVQNIRDYQNMLEKIMQENSL